jgi:hypothetical protein
MFEWEEGGERKRCQTSVVWQLEGDLADWNSFEAEIMGGQGLTLGCSAVGGRE